MIVKSISNHPVHSSITRTATLVDLTWNTENSIAYVGLLINHFLDGNAIPQLDKKIQTIQDNTMQIPLDPNDPNSATIGDYDAFALRLYNGDSFKSVVEDGISLADAIGKINEKMNY